MQPVEKSECKDSSLATPPRKRGVQARPKKFIRVGPEHQADIPDILIKIPFTEDMLRETPLPIHSNPTILERMGNPKSFSEAEHDAFVRGYSIHTVNFDAIKLEFLPHRPLKDIIWFYHLWQKDPRVESLVAPLKSENFFLKGDLSGTIPDVCASKKNIEQAKQTPETELPKCVFPVRETWLCTDQMQVTCNQVLKSMGKFRDEKKKKIKPILKRTDRE